ncbi:hypothetical protein ASG36_07640 [Geodermatophilus sp. Leaf369]|uniref:Brp/Blh family beta-carotene 15,15'-dioxygenase n=1 Tax=Geodermatophilus sp. Leaf369 TaxID=1736354 RepID=UPI0006F8673C|nr:Brp/Blh family beta-carotene 15,15'-dioxygenase [Geodermatophilus sp. Leaf369]KQS60741.1 hypothetical protein ASG36_07640 [Geodermatophilus sp. Leaf369]
MLQTTGQTRTPRGSGPAGRAGRARPSVALGRALVLLVLAAQLLDPDLVARAAPVLAMVGIVLGVPHGAVDHMVPFWTGGRRPTPATLASVLAGYLAVAALAAIALLLAPTVTVTAFLLVSVLHFGRAEAVVCAEDAGRPVPGPLQDVATTLAHGLAVVGLPLVLWPQESARVLGHLAPAWGVPLPTSARVLLGLVLVGAVLLSAAGALRRGRPVEAAELVMVVALFTVVPPLAAFGVWFAGWHALRHTARLVALVRGGPSAPGPARAAGRVALHAAVPTVVSLGAVVVLAGPAASPAAVGAALAVVLALTFPHVRTVAALDRSARQRY